MPSASAQPEYTERFLSILYGDQTLTENAAIVIWPGRGQRTEWCTSIAQAAAATARHAPERDVYFGVCLQNKPEVLREAERRREQRGGQPNGGVYARGYAETVSVMPGVWLDVDYGREGHEQSDLPPDAESALELLQALPLAPSLTIATLGGFHAYWIFREPYALTCPDDHLRATAISRGWGYLAYDLAQNRGWKIDRAWDLARVLRPPGSLNHKHGAGLIVPREWPGEHDERRYNPGDFDDFAASVHDLATTTHAAATAGGVLILPGTIGAALTGDAAAPADKLALLQNIVPGFSATWSRTRTDLPSQSEYDLALASFMARAEWTDVEIVSALIQHRRVAGQDQRLNRPDYYARTLTRVRRTIVRTTAEDEIRADVELASLPTPAPEDRAPGATETRDGVVRRVSVVVGVDLGGLVHYRSSLATGRAAWALRVAGLEVPLSSVEDVLQNNRFRAAIAGATGQLIPRMKNDRWDPLARALLASRVEEDLGPDTEPGEVVRDYVLDYLRSSRPTEDMAEATVHRTPCLASDGTPCLFLEPFWGWLATRGVRWTRAELGRELRAAGAAHIRLEAVVPVEGGGSRVVRPRVWGCPWATGHVEPVRREVRG